MRRRLSLSLALATAIVGLAAAGFLSAPASTSSSPAAPSTRSVSSPLVDMEAVPAAAPRIDAIDGQLRLVTPKPAPPVVLLFGCALALAVAASILRGRRPGRAVSVPAWSASLRGPPRLAAL